MGCELAGRLAGENRREEKFASPLKELAAEVRADRQELRALMDRLGIGVDRAKQLAGWTAEKLGRLKLNGQLLGYSPLSRVVELEALRLGIAGKQAMWRTLLDLADGARALDAEELRRFERRAVQQLKAVDDLHREAVTEAFRA